MNAKSSLADLDLATAKRYVEVLQRIDGRFGCLHVHGSQGPDDADNIVRHLDELFDQLAAAELKIKAMEALLRDGCKLPFMASSAPLETQVAYWQQDVRKLFPHLAEPQR